MKFSKWYIRQSAIGNEISASIREEVTDLIVAEFPAVDNQSANKRSIELKAIVDVHNELVKAYKEVTSC